ncbi:MAG: hypothetical protein QM662_14020 [Gordonia sp. (in: high G+C Gram-positive bacteria)]
MPPELDPGLAGSLRKIERRVLAEVPLHRRRVLTLWTAIVLLAAAVLLAWVSGDIEGDRTPLLRVAVGFGVAASVMSTAAVIRRRFGWCWIAAALSAVAVPMSVLGYWSAQTAQHLPSYGLLVAAVCHVVLVANWVRSVLVPVGRR